jgi:hypothetical protein
MTVVSLAVWLLSCLTVQGMVSQDAQRAFGCEKQERRASEYTNKFTTESNSSIQDT